VNGSLRAICDWQSLWLCVPAKKPREKIENENEGSNEGKGPKLGPTRRYSDLYFATFAIKNKYAIKQNDNGPRHMHYCPALRSYGNIC